MDAKTERAVALALEYFKMMGVVVEATQSEEEAAAGLVHLFGPAGREAVERLDRGGWSDVLIEFVQGLETERRV